MSSDREGLLGRMAPIEAGCPPVWERVLAIIEEGFSTGRYGRGTK